MTRTGLDRANSAWPDGFREARAALLCHPASVDSGLSHASDIFLRHKQVKLKRLFGPQHGIRGETQANMIEWQGFRDGKTGLPVFSLYGVHRKPTPEMLSGIDVLICDLVDVGARYYTYIWTLYLCMEACAEQGVRVVVLDRPNPIDGVTVEGPVLDRKFASFVGLKPLAIRHGLTIGEIAMYFKGEFIPGVDLKIIRMTGWRRDSYYEKTGLSWINPSPNVPTVETALVYPGMCLLEGANISEGRGTTRPFELFGAPFMDADKTAGYLNKLKLPGVLFRPAFFKPTFDKFTGRICGGAQIHVTSRRKFKPFLTGMAVLKAAMELCPGKFKWLKGPYEYESRLRPIDILFGNGRTCKMVERGAALGAIERSYAKELDGFKKIRRKYLLY
jgi:uncharacterized protein YbbC (DUF1343 family)